MALVAAAGVDDERNEQVNTEPSNQDKTENKLTELRKPGFGTDDRRSENKGTLRQTLELNS